jgi:predicted DNA-binding transcriptional regulator YafY
MRRAERLFRLVNEMRARGVSRAEDLATHFEVSVRTIYRDIAHLQGSGLPIEGEAGIGYLLRPGFDLPSLTFTFDQVDALAIGLSFVESTGDPALADAAREVRAKLQASLPQPESRKLADAPYFAFRRGERASPFSELLRTAIRQKVILQMSYADGEGKQSERRVRPLAVWSFTDGWMFAAWCELRADFRTFRFDRIIDLELTRDQFEDEDAQGLRAYIKGQHAKRKPVT